MFADLQTQLAELRARASGPARGDVYGMKHPDQGGPGGGGLSGWGAAMVSSVPVQLDSRSVADQGLKPGVGTALPSDSLAPRGAGRTTNAADSILLTDRSLEEDRTSGRGGPYKL